MKNPLTQFVLTLDELAGVLRCHKSTIYRMVKAGELPVFKIGTEYRIRREDVRAMLERRDAWSSTGRTGRPKSHGRG